MIEGNKQNSNNQSVQWQNCCGEKENTVCVVCALMCEYMYVHKCSREGLKDGVKLTQTTRDVRNSSLSA